MIQPRNKYFDFPFILVVIVLAGLTARWLSWPGFSTHDTLWATREAIDGDYTTYHPLLNALLLRLLAVPFDSYWLYTSLQIGWCCILLYQSYRLTLDGPAHPVLARLSVLLWAASVPTLLYLGIIWKDVPIAYGLVFMAALLFRLRSEPGYEPRMLDAALLGLSLFLCLGLRHGMVLNAILVPALIGWRRVSTTRRLWMPMVLAVIGFVFLQVLGSTKLVQNDSAHLLKLKISAVSQPFLAIVTNKNGYTSDDYDYDRQLTEATFGKKYAEEFTSDYFRNTVVLESEQELENAYRAILKRSPRLCATNFSLCVSGRTQMFLGTLQPSTSFGGMTFYDLGAFEKCGKDFAMEESQCDLLEEFETSEKTKTALDVQRLLQPRFFERRSTAVNIFVWNLLPAFSLLVMMLVFGRAFSPPWLVGVFFSAQLVLPFMTAMANDFRYYYFLFPFAVVFAPLMLGLGIDLLKSRKSMLDKQE